MFTAEQKELVNNALHFNEILKSRIEMLLREHSDAKEVMSSYFAAKGFHPFKAALNGLHDLLILHRLTPLTSK